MSTDRAIKTYVLNTSRPTVQGVEVTRKDTLSKTSIFCVVIVRFSDVQAVRDAIAAARRLTKSLIAIINVDAIDTVPAMCDVLMQSRSIRVHKECPRDGDGDADKQTLCDVIARARQHDVDLSQLRVAPDKLYVTSFNPNKVDGEWWRVMSESTAQSTRALIRSLQRDVLGPWRTSPDSKMIMASPQSIRRRSREDDTAVETKTVRPARIRAVPVTDGVFNWLVCGQKQWHITHDTIIIQSPGMIVYAPPATSSERDAYDIYATGCSISVDMAMDCDEY